MNTNEEPLLEDMVIETPATKSETLPTRQTRPLPTGSKIEYCGMLGTVIRDDGGERIGVEADGYLQNWYWRFDGVDCIVIDVACPNGEDSNTAKASTQIK